MVFNTRNAGSSNLHVFKMVTRGCIALHRKRTGNKEHPKKEETGLLTQLGLLNTARSPIEMKGRKD